MAETVQERELRPTPANKIQKDLTHCFVNYSRRVTGRC